MDEAKARRAIVRDMGQSGATFKLAISASRASWFHAKALEDVAHADCLEPVTLMTRLSRLPLSYRARMVLAAYDDLNVADLLTQDSAALVRDLLRLPNFGRAQWNELDQILRRTRETL